MMDDKDRKILLQLLDDGRKPVVEIANELGMPRATVQERMRRLVGWCNKKVYSPTRLR